LLAPLVRRIAAVAPGIIVEWVPIGPGLPERMVVGEVDLTFALDTTPLPRGAASAPLFEDRLAVVMREDHPSGGRWRIEDYATWPSVVVALIGDQASDLDAELAAAGVERRIAAIVPTFRAAAAIVAVTDNVTTISRAFADRLADALRLWVIDAPLAGTRLGGVVVWAAHRSGDALLGWLREQLRLAAGDLG